MQASMKVTKRGTLGAFVSLVDLVMIVSLLLGRCPYFSRGL
jgi:hypothetical protein